MILGPIKILDKFVITNRDHGDERPYLTRWRLVDTPWFGVFLHRFHRPDAAPTYHDHPWSFVAVVLTGAYVEHCRDPRTGEDRVEVHGPRRHRVNRKRLSDAHYISGIDLHKTTRSLVFVGPTRRGWGYWERPFPGDVWTWTPWRSHPHHADRPVVR